MGRKNYLLFKDWIFFSFVLTLVSIALAACPTYAQEDEFVLEEVVVTGSRIVRNNNESASPIVTVDESLFNQSSTMAIETQLNKLPQFTPTVDLPTNGGDIQPTARNTPGEATVALRGIGQNRTLVLINGRRGTPSNGMGVLDINTIPTAAIQYVEAISGGASSTYGADAMAGVLNFIMRDKFEGFEFRAQTGMTQEGDNFEYQVSGIGGTNFKDDRGNVMLSFSYNERNDARQGDRDWYRKLWADPSVGGSAFRPYLTGLVPDSSRGYTNLPDVNVLNSVLDGATFTSTPAGVTYYQVDGQAVTGFDRGSEPGIPSAQAAGIVDGYNFKLMNNGRLAQNVTDYYLIFPLERYNMFSQGNYQINDWIGVFGMGYFSNVYTQTLQAPGTITAGWGVRVYPEYNRDVIPGELLAILDSRPDPDGPFLVRAPMPQPRRTLTTTTTWNMTTGLEGQIPGIDWSWEAYVSHGAAQTYSQSTGYVSLERIRAVMSGVAGYNEDGTPYFYDGYKNFGEGFRVKSNAQDGGFGAATATCASGLNPYDWGTMTPDCWDAIKADVKTRMLMEQDIFEVNAQGSIADLPAGELRGALGYSRRENTFNFLSDNLNAEGSTFNDQILGLYPSADSGGSISVDETYAEILIPIVKDLPFIKQLNLELGGRRSDYDTTGVSYTYKGLADWKITDYLRLRGGYNRAERAPNIAELFLNPEQVLGVYSYGDVCSMNNAQAYSANSSTNPAGWANVVNLCGNLMVRDGEDTDITYYGADFESIVAYANANPGAKKEDLVTAGVITQDDLDNQTSGTIGYVWPLNVGNPNLDPEKADTWTAGIVLDSPFVDIPYLANLRISVDYYSIDITDAIGEQSADIVMYQCVSSEFNPNFDPNSSYCDGFRRDPRFGSIGLMEKSFYNNGRFSTSGIDVQIDWAMELGPGQVKVKSLINYLIDKSSSELDSNPMIDYTGTFGPTENGLNGNSYEWRALTNFTYAWNDIDLTLRWQWKDSIEQAAAARGISTTTGAPSYSLFDLVGNYQLFDNTRLNFGIENLFNEEPPLIGRNLSDATGMYGGSFNSQNYDINGRRFYVGVRVYF